MADARVSGLEAVSVTRFLVSPPVLASWLGEAARKRIMYLDVEVDQDKGGVLRIDLNLAFSPIKIRRGVFKRADYYVGCTTAEVSCDVAPAMVQDYTRDHEIKVDYTREASHNRVSSVEIRPAVKVKGGSTEYEVSGGGVTFEANAVRKFATSFSSSERTLVAVRVGKSVQWAVDQPRADMVVRDFLLGNLHLFLVGQWQEAPRKWSIEVRSDVRFFNDKRKPVCAANSLVMRYLLHKRVGVPLSTLEPCTVAFVEVE